MTVPIVVSRFLDTHGKAINLAQCSPDSRYIVGGGGVIKQPGDIVVWDAVTLQVTELRTSQNATIHKLVVSPDSRTLAVSTHGGFGNVELWDMQTWQYITTLRPPKETLVGDISFSPDCRTLAVGYWDMSAKIWDLALGEMYELPSE